MNTFHTPKTIDQNIFFINHIRRINLTLKELKLIAKSRGIKNYKNMSKESLLSALDESERNSIERKVNNFNNVLIKKIR